MSDRGWDLFIAYPRAERAAGDELYRELVQGGASVFLDHLCLDAGAVWPAAIAAAQDAARVTVVLVSKQSTAAFYVDEEIQRGIARARVDPARHRFVPVFVDDDSDPPYGLLQIERLSLDDAGGMAAVACQLLALTRRLDRSATFRVDADQHPEEPGQTERDIDTVPPDSAQVAPFSGPMRPGRNFGRDFP